MKNMSKQDIENNPSKSVTCAPNITTQSVFMLSSNSRLIRKYGSINHTWINAMCVIYWLIKGLTGELYACRSKPFEKLKTKLRISLCKDYLFLFTISSRFPQGQKNVLQRGQTAAESFLLNTVLVLGMRYWWNVWIFSQVDRCTKLWDM